MTYSPERSKYEATSPYMSSSTPADKVDPAKHRAHPVAGAAGHGTPAGNDLIAGDEIIFGGKIQTQSGLAAGGTGRTTDANLPSDTDLEDEEAAEEAEEKAEAAAFGDIPNALKTETQLTAQREYDAKTSKKAKAKDKNKVEEEPAKPRKLTLAELLAKPMDAMEYGTTARPPIKGLTNVIADLPVELIVDGKDEGGVPTLSTPAGLLRRRRFVFVGDVHGQRKPLEELLDKIDFKVGNDHLILVGDLINKGPDSAGVVQLAMELGSSAVRGNHEDRVLVAYQSLHASDAYQPPLVKPKKAPAGIVDTTETETVNEGETEAEAERTRLVALASIEAEGKIERAEAALQREMDLKEENAKKGKGILALLGLKKNHESEEDTIDHDKAVTELNIDPLEQNPFSHGDSAERATAATLTHEQAQWLSERPVILRLGSIAPSAAVPLSAAAQQANAKSPFANNEVVVVHAGLVPDVPLEQQDPYAVMVMRSLVHPADEVRHERAHLIAEARVRSKARGRLRNTDHISVPHGRIEAEYHRLQKLAYGADPHHPRRPSPVGSTPRRSCAGDGHPEPADLVMLPIEGHFREGTDRVHWAAVWNQAQHAIADPANRTTVVYGHDAITGLLLPETVPSGLFSLFSSSSSSSSGANSGSVITEEDTGYTFGLDSGAVYGGKLTALVVEADKDGVVKHHIEQVPCPAIAPKKYAD
ncbi:hypothetical protein HMPREF1624_03573 [Sporothrix schenckii ATCC 58251]|uniref:Calcineurin-like phosphoesterase domain-containing protein n=1 Tax=Sporothrix schenckii (strain ATCC 58251 / de Perez 2211183) TaxID=1391915 RepID=U7PZ25_SPOS1|nr:hypothetical protein HMPREF1624_03573 [Sporothrix schenckii ATCC 58251]